MYLNIPVLDIPNVFKEPFSNESKNVSTKITVSPNTTNNLQQIHFKQSLSTSAVLKSVKGSNSQIITTEKCMTDRLNDREPSCSHYENDLQPSVKIKTEPININNVLSQGTYRNEEDSVIVIYSSDEENNLESLIPNIKIELEQMHVDSKSTTDSSPSTSKGENLREWSIHCQRNETVSEDEDDDDIIYIPPESNSNIINTLLDTNDSDSDCNSRCLKVIEPLPLRANIRRGKKKTEVLVENENIMKTRARSEKRLNNKKKAEEITADQNKQIIQERRLKLQQLAEDKLSNKTQLTDDHYIDKCSTTENLKKKTRISRLQNRNNDCIPSTSKLHLATEVEKNFKFNNPEKTSKNVGSSSSKMNLLSFTYFDTLSIICKWNAVWLHVS